MAKIDKQKKTGFSRRDILQAFIALPVFGVFLYKLFNKRSLDNNTKNEILKELGIDQGAPTILPKTTMKKSGELIRLGIIGFGGRGKDLVRAAGFATPDWIDEKKKDMQKDKMNKSLEDYLSQEDLNVALNGVCEVFDVRAENGLAASKIDLRPGAAPSLPMAKRYRHYHELLESKDIDAVIIATPDHWHAQMTIDAVNAGKHVYCEKCMTRTEEETLRMFDAVVKSGKVFQLGHQNRQLESHMKAKELIMKNILGEITLIETTTNRNSPNGAWVYDIHEKGSPNTIDWEQFQGPAPHKVAFSKERFFRWRCWYDYGTGLSGDLLSHEYDAVNQIMDLGIPRTATASGGIYFYKDGRDVPDVFQAVFEYPDRNLTYVYSATLASNEHRGKIIMGHDASMHVSNDLIVNADPESTRYREKIDKGIIDTSFPLFSYSSGSRGLDVITSATEKYFASRGLLYTYRGGKRVSTAHLHVAEWLNCIRHGGQPSCNIDRGFEEAIICHMATRSYLEGRRVEWDPVKRKIV